MAEDRAKYLAQCRAVIGTSKSVRFACAINRHGRTVAGAFRPGVKPMLGPVQARNEFSVIAALLSLRREHESKIGALKHCVLSHKNVTIILYYDASMTYYVSVNKTEKRIPQLVSKIARVI